MIPRERAAMQILDQIVAAYDRGEITVRGSAFDATIGAARVYLRAVREETRPARLPYRDD